MTVAWFTRHQAKILNAPNKLILSISGVSGNGIALKVRALMTSDKHSMTTPRNMTRRCKFKRAALNNGVE